jgi:hypothetical protein
MSTQPFEPTGRTICVEANATAPLGTQCVGDGMPATTYRVTNDDANQTIFYAMSISPPDGSANLAVESRSRALIPAKTSTGNYGVPLPVGAVEVIRGPANAYFSAITRTAAAANLFVTPGEGM